MTPSFDHDTALEPVGEGRWRATVSEHWFVTDGIWGSDGTLLAHSRQLALVRSPR